ncbi:helix-turn-helix domain-containing protein [Sphingomonas abietis]|uniref:Helix-turn-helix domain-containing protein n=1 Tax=Sphingomonas abietis TaxID=3012344 RepID=A0ABY7NS14_9SPHN|nr:helix-turn-helix domain-containing protein [Sphingomonas abietis]
MDNRDDDAVARAERAREGSPFLSNAEAAHYIGLHWRTLETMRGKGHGPRFRRHGRFIRYHIDDLDNWSRDSGGTRAPKGGSDV